MLKKFEEITKKINELEEDINLLENEVKTIEQKAFTDLLNVCKGGFKFTNIYKEKYTYNDNGSDTYKDELSYHKDLKAVLVCYETLEENSNIYGSNYVEIELFLTDKYNFIVFEKKADTTNYQGGTNKYERYISENFSIDFFEVEDIINGLLECLKEKLSNMNNRKSTQLNRIEQLKKIQIK